MIFFPNICIALEILSSSWEGLSLKHSVPFTYNEYCLTSILTNSLYKMYFTSSYWVMFSVVTYHYNLCDNKQIVMIKMGNTPTW